MQNKISVNTILAKKGRELITSLTAYDYLSAKILDEAGVDIILVGDSLGMVIQGENSTLSVTLDEMIYHGKITRRGIKNAFLVVDMPFGSANSVEEGVNNAVRVIKETGADAIKLEGADEITLKIIERLLDIGVLTMAHIGLQPQKVNVMGGFKAQGYNNYERIIGEALSLEKAGAKMIILEGLAPDCAKEITSKLTIPTIGIGAGSECDGQILVYHDVFGFSSDFKPKFVKQYAKIGEILTNAAKDFIREVKDKSFPSKEYSYKESK